MPHRYFTADIEGETAFLRGDEAHHLGRVMRAKPGQELVLCDGAGTDYDARVVDIQKDEVRLEILSSKRCESEPRLAVTLYVGYPKQDKLESIIQKAVELGAVRIVPFFSRYCVVQPKKEEEKNLRYRRIALEAAKQSGRGIVPEVAMPLTYAQMLKQLPGYDAALFCYEGGGVSLHSRLEGAGSIALITGAEGGFSAEEAGAAQAAGAVCIGLGPRILRCETAPVAALAAVMALTGELG